MIHPGESVDGDGEAFVDIAVAPQEKDRIAHLLDRYDALLAQAEDLSSQIEGLLREWNPTPSPPTPSPPTPSLTGGPASNPSLKDGSDHQG